MTEETTKTIARGGNRAVQRQAEEKANRKSSNFVPTWSYFNLKGPEGSDVYGESAVLRFVTDEQDWADAKVHSWVPTKDQPADYPENAKPWRKQQDAVCRYTLDGNDNPIYDDCYICDNIKVPGKGKLVKPYASPKVWAVAVVRKPVIGTKEHVAQGLIEDFQVGRPAFYEDETVELGNGDIIKKFVVVNQSMGNFFDALLGFHQVYGTLLDRDFRITRKGKGTETSYDIVPLDPVAGPDGKKLDLNRPETAKEYEAPFSLDEIVLSKASDRHYNWFFNEDVVSTWAEQYPKKDEDGSVDSDSTPDVIDETEAAPVETGSVDRIEAMRSRIKDTQAKTKANA